MAALKHPLAGLKVVEIAHDIGGGDSSIFVSDSQAKEIDIFVAAEVLQGENGDTPLARGDR